MSNLVKQICEDYSLSYKELGEIIGVSPTTLSTIASTGKVSKAIEASLNLYIEKEEYKEKIEKVENFRESLDMFLKQRF